MRDKRGLRDRLRRFGAKLSAKGASLTLGLLLAGGASAEELIHATMHKMPYCTCCEGHAEHLRANGFEVEIKEVPDLTPIRRAEGVPTELEGCHTILIDGLIVEGHVSAGTIKRFLNERPMGVDGIVMKGMPAGVPGMPGPKEGPINILTFGEGEPTVFAVE
jgi:hypothetical protein